jgi:hypothetical protein
MTDKPIFCMFYEYSPKCPNIRMLKKHNYRPVCATPDQISDTGFELRTNNCPNAGGIE